MAQAKIRPMGVGIAVGGLIDHVSGSIAKMNLAPSLAGMPLSRFVSERHGLETVVDHHPRAILLGERWFGEGRGLRNFAVIYADEVLGCSLYLDGKPFRGPHGSGGELGHTIVDAGGRTCAFGRTGRWETVATLGRLSEAMREVGLAVEGTPDVARLAELSETDAVAEAVFDAYARTLAIGMASLQTLLMPDNYMVYGGATRGGEAIRRRLEASLRDLPLTVPGTVTSVRFGQDEAAATLHGAAGLVISRQLSIDY